MKFITRGRLRDAAKLRRPKKKGRGLRKKTRRIGPFLALVEVATSNNYHQKMSTINS